MRFYIMLFAVVFGCILVSPDASAYTKVGRTKKEKSYNSNASYTPIKYNLLFKGTFGGVVGKAGEALGDDSNILFYGFGVSGEYHLAGRHAFTAAIDLLYKNYKRGNFDEKFHVTGYSVGWLLKLRKEKIRNPFLSLETGFGTVHSESSFDFKKSQFVKIGFGVINHTASSINLRFKLYYQLFMPNNDVKDNYLIDYDVSIIGLEGMFGIPL